MTRTLVPFTSRLPRLWGDFEREMEDTMRRLFAWDRDGGEDTLAFAPDLNVAETDGGCEVTVDLPGMKPEEVIGSKPDTITRGQINMSKNKEMWKTIRDGKIFRDEIPYTFRDGKKYWLSVTVSPGCSIHSFFQRFLQEVFRHGNHSTALLWLAVLSETAHRGTTSARWGNNSCTRASIVSWADGVGLA